MTNKRVDAVVNTVNVAGTLNIITEHFIFTKSTFLAETSEGLLKDSRSMRRTSEGLWIYGLRTLLVYKSQPPGLQDLFALKESLLPHKIS